MDQTPSASWNPEADASDEALLRDYRAAPATARQEIAGVLFSRHYERVARWCLRFTGDRESAADLAQDVFLKAHRHLAEFEGAARLSTWLYTIARNEAINRGKRHTPETAPEEVLVNVPALDPSPEEVVSVASRSRSLQRFLSETLDELERTVFTLHYGDDMPLDAITRLLALENRSGAKAFIVSARRKLARAVERLSARGGKL